MPVIIIESPNKVKKVKTYSEMEVFATIGHFMELKDVVEENFKPIFEYMPDKKKSIFYYLERCKGQEVYIATDPDREGYAIGKMFYDKVKNIAKAVYRAEFHEITETGIKKGLKEAKLFSNTNTEFYNSFLARRVGDRLIGFSLSPYLSKSLSVKGLSVGRVQTPALSLIVQREREILNFEKLSLEEKTSHQIQGKLEQFDLIIKHIDSDGKEIRFENQDEAHKIFNSLLDQSQALVTDIKISQVKKSPPKPFITSTLLKAGSTQLKLGTQRIQQLAQMLFEAGLITYIRTDAEILSQEFLQEYQEFYSQIYPQYQRREYKAKNSQAEAHEAIRITHCHRHEEINEILDREDITDPEARALYKIIFKNTICSQAKDALYEQQEIFFKVRMCDFKCVSKRVIDRGYLDIFQEEEKEEISTFITNVRKGDLLKISELFLKEIQKEAPQRFKEADFVSILEKRGIGRPSTYATYIPLLLNRDYIQIIDEKNRVIAPTNKGISVIDFLSNDLDHKWILDLDFTKEMEEKLDLIVEKKFQYLSFMQELNQKIPSNNTSENEKRNNQNLESKIYPPTEKQIKFVELIANSLKLEIPIDYKNNVFVCKNFIDKNIQTFNQSKNKPT